MDHQRTIWIKEEVANDISCSSDSMLLQDPLKIDEPCFDIKADPEEELNVGSYKHFCLGQPFVIPGSAKSIKEEPELDLTEETENFIEANRVFSSAEYDHPRVKKEVIETNRVFSSAEYDPLRVKKEVIEANRVFSSAEYDPLRVKKEVIEANRVLSSAEYDHPRVKKEVIEESRFNIPEYDCLRIKKEEGSASDNDCLDEYDSFSITDDEEVASTRCSPDNTRLIQIHGDAGSTAVEENCLLGVTGDNVEIDAKKTAHIIGRRTTGPNSSCQEVTALCGRDKYNLEDNHLVCSSCKQTFSSKYSLIMHVFIHIDGVQPPAHICKLCGEVFISYDSLGKHCLTHQVNQERYNLCNTVSTELDNPICQEVCSGKLTINGQQSSVCGESFTDPDHPNRYAVIGTVKKHHNYAERGKYLTRSNRLKEDDLVDAIDISHKCDECGKSFTSSGFLKRHALKHMGIDISHKCEECGKSFKSSGFLKRHALKHISHKCDECGKSFTTSGFLKRHALKHMGIDISHKCDECGKSFKTSGFLKRHALIHTERSPHICNVCGKSFPQSSGLKTHAVVHTREKAHECSVCGKSFSLPDNLKKHEITHTPRQEYKCDVCGKSFAYPGRLKKHAVIHTRERHHNYVSMKSFNYYDWFKKRLIIHTENRPYKCGVCGKSFSQPGSLKDHSLIHSSEKAHKCGVCGKSFTQSLRLKVHELIHTAKRPHKCSLCGKSFTQSDDLKKHELIHSGESSY